MLVKASGGIVLSIDDNSRGCDLTAVLPTAVEGIQEEELAQSLPAEIPADGEASE